VDVRWHGQSAFTLDGTDATVTVDPFGDMSALTQGRGMTWAYPPVPEHPAGLLLITHEHLDHNAADRVTGEPVVLRAAAGTFESPIGQVVGVNSEHDDQAGTARGPNTIFVFGLDGIRIAHFGDFGQAALRPAQRAALGRVDLLFVPTGGGPTIGPDQAYEIVTQLEPTWVVPMHYKTEAADFLPDTVEPFAERFGDVRRVDGATFAIDRGAAPAGPQLILPSVPV
jgi:L-ascorbate metabolism protein UlaG (beta-lactamase superfamily)